MRLETLSSSIAHKVTFQTAWALVTFYLHFLSDGSSGNHEHLIQKTEWLFVSESWTGILVFRFCFLLGLQSYDISRELVINTLHLLVVLVLLWNHINSHCVCMCALWLTQQSGSMLEDQSSPWTRSWSESSTR